MRRPAWDADPGLLLAWAYMNVGTAEQDEYRRYCQGGPLPRREEKRRVTSVRRIPSAVKADMMGLPCTYCGAASDTVDHRVAVTRGGTSDLENLLPACWPCNRMKGALPEDEFRAVIAEFESAGASLAAARSLMAAER